MADKSRLELRVGLFVFIGLIILIIFILSIKGIKSFTSTYNLNIVFGFVNGVKIGAPVRLAGFDVGEVKDIKIFFDEDIKKMRVNILVGIKKGVNVPLDSTVWINTLGLLGEKYIEIMPGSNEVAFYRPGETIIGSDPVAMHEVGALLRKIAYGVDDIITQMQSGEGTLGKLIYDSRVYNDIEEMFGDLKKNPWKLLYKSRK